jgi:hypothetical protein
MKEAKNIRQLRQKAKQGDLLALVTLGSIYQSENSNDKARTYYQKALEIHEVKIGEEHSAERLWIELADFHLNSGRGRNVFESFDGSLSTALKYYLRALEVYEKRDDLEDPGAIGLYVRIANTYRAEEDNFEDSPKSDAKGRRYVPQPDALRELEVKETQYSVKDQDIVGLYAKIASSYSGQLRHPGDLGTLNNRCNEKALEYYLKALELHEIYFGEEDPRIINLWLSIAKVYERLGRWPADNFARQSSLEYYLKAAGALEARQRENSEYVPFMSYLWERIGEVYGSLDDHQAALKSYQKSMEIHEACPDKDDRHIVDLLRSMALTYSRLGVFIRILEKFIKNV